MHYYQKKDSDLLHGDKIIGDKQITLNILFYCVQWVIILYPGLICGCASPNKWIMLQKSKNRIIIGGLWLYENRVPERIRETPEVFTTEILLFQTAVGYGSYVQIVALFFGIGTGGFVNSYI